MSFVNMQLGGVNEPKALPDGRYDLTVTEVNENVKEGKLAGYRATIIADGQPEAQAIMHFISLPQPDDDAKKAQYKTLLLKRFLVTFGVPFEDHGFNIEDIVGATAQSVLVSSTYNESNGMVYNNLVLDRLPDQS